MSGRYPNIYPQFAHDPACRCCHPNDRPYCPCPCHSAAPGEMVALRARWDSECRVPEGPDLPLPGTSPRRAPAPARPAPLRPAAPAKPGRVVLRRGGA